MNNENHNMFLESFKAGDVVTVDGGTFPSPFQALLLGDEEGNVRILYRDGTTFDWKTSVFKLRTDRNEYSTFPTPRLTHFKGELPASDVFLSEIGKRIGGDDKKGHLVWCMLNGYGVEYEEPDPGIKDLISEVTYRALLECYCPD